METEDLSPEEREAFDSLPSQEIPPKYLEEETISKLEAKGLIRSKVKRKVVWILYPVAASILFLLGFFSRSLVDQPIDKTHGYALVLFEDENFYIENPAEAAKEYQLWNEKMNEAGVIMNGQELRNEAHEVSGGGITFLASDIETRITGYFLIEASSDEEAISIAQQCPHVGYGGSIQVKKFMVR